MNTRRVTVGALAGTIIFCRSLAIGLNQDFAGGKKHNCYSFHKRNH
jgi:hypothetical protein